MKIKKILKILFLNLRNFKFANIIAIKLFLILFILNKLKVINLEIKNKDIKKNFMQYTLR